jgi:hypothetical protein
MDIVINLAGKSLFTLWTDKNKKVIYNSRIETSKRIARVLNEMSSPPGHLLNASAIGIYKPEVNVDEYSNLYDDGFLAKVVKDWENSLDILKDNEKIRVTKLRFGIVLGKEGGAYRIFRRLSRFSMAAVFGQGEQSLSFAYINDLVRAVDFIIAKKIEGPVNIVSPETSSYRELMQKLKSQFNSLIVWKIPPFFPRTFLGETSEMILQGQMVEPKVLLENNFNFEASNISQCVNKLEEN